MKKLTTSPVIKKNEFLPTDFPQAIRAVINGKKITKLEWGFDGYYGIMKDGFLMLHKPDGKDYTWTVSEADMTGTDWVVLPDTN
jgi:hypothetical protein